MILLSLILLLFLLFQTENTSLRDFNPAVHTTELLPLSVAHIEKSSQNHHQLDSWLQSVWVQLRNVADLQRLKDLPLIPSNSCTLTVKGLVSLSSPIVVRNLDVPEEFVETLRLLKINVLDKWPSFASHHTIHHYYSGIDSRGVLIAMEKMFRHENINSVASVFNGKCTEQQRITFCNQMGRALDFSSQVINFLRKLDLFKAVGRNAKRNASVDNVSKIYPSVKYFPVSISESLLYPCNQVMRNLAVSLGAEQLTTEDICLMALKNCSEQDAEKLGWYIISDRDLSRSEKICTDLKKVRFITSAAGRICMASELYDPFDDDKDALLGEELIPSDKYRRHNDLLKCLGLKAVRNMPRQDLIKILKKIPTSILGRHECEVKVKSLFRIINGRSDYPEMCESIRRVKCIRGVSTRPYGYPSNLEWATRDGLYEPSDVRSFSSFANIAGSVIPLVDCCDIHNVAHYFNWNEEPSVDNIMQHFRNITKVCAVPSKLPGTPCYDHIKQIYQLLNTYVGTPKQRSLHLLCQEAIVFTASGFKLPSEVYVPSGKEDLQLLPYMHALPLELCEYKKLFCVLGAFEKQSLPLFYKVLRQIQSSHNSCGTLDSEHDLKVVISVLFKMAEDKDSIDRKQLLLPVETLRRGLELVEVGGCAYSDQDCEWLDEDELGVRVIHKRVEIPLAKSLGVEPLNKHLLADEEAVMEWGQREPLTTRIHNLLRQYRDGVAVLKELVQNADDAGATQISFLYDERQSSDSCKRLITDQLKECQGPALWAYNNAAFTEKDFENLCKLGGATKELLCTKIGKFGLGFCSVYNITDVPSFVSGSNYIIFDPHQTYLVGEKAGVRYNFAKKMNRIMLKKLDGQFQPFLNVFGCRIQETNSFDGTLFRLPLRTPAQANVSKISSQSYTHKDTVELLKMFREIIGEILLFTQNIQEIKVFHLGKDGLPQNRELLYESCRKNSKLSNEMQISSRSLKGNPVENTAMLYDVNHKWNGQLYEENMILDIKVACSSTGAQMVHGKEGSSSVTWLMSWHSGSNDSCKLAEKREGKVVSLACIALPVERKKGTWKPKKLAKLPDGFYKESHMHCFLPLPVKTTLPVQVNGFFEVASDRTSLITRTEDDRHVSDDWNITLMKDAVNSAYISLLVFLRREGLCQETPFFKLWPVSNENSSQLVVQLTKSFYGAVEQKDLEVLRNNSGWYPLSKCLFLSESFYRIPDIGRIVFEFVRNFHQRCTQKQVMELPQKMVALFGEDISRSVISENIFFTEYFLPNLSQNYIDQEKQKTLLLHIIDTQEPLLSMLKDICCIPTLPNGKLRKPGDLVDPKSNVAPLYNNSDERFPLDIFTKGNRRFVLSRLGMHSESVDDDMVRERAMSVNELSCFHCAAERSSEILNYMHRNYTQTDKIASQMSDISFLPVKKKPENWTMRWKGDEGVWRSYTSCARHLRNSNHFSIFVSPNSLCSPNLIRLAGSIHFIQAHSSKPSYPQSVCKKLGVITSDEALPLCDVISQLTEYSQCFQSLDFSYLTNVCGEIYGYMDNKARENGQILSELRNEKMLLTKFGFVEPLYFAVDGEINCSPALFSLEREGLEKYSAMIRNLKIPQDFPCQMVYDKLLHKYQDFQTTKVPEEEVVVISNLLNLLFRLKDKDGNALALTDLHLPDSQGVMRPIKDLCIDDGSLEEGKVFYFLHQKLHYSQEMLRWLGIEEKVKKRFRDLCNRLPFGQKEPLTTRLRNILDNYPYDTGIMKELLQNADDSGATEIAFIKDERDLPTEKLFDEKWAPLQGPSLCVYNNKGFTMKDLEGIQNLGNSTKIDDPASTGQYGIGFNAVYHLTDAPSFLTRGEDISIDCSRATPENETLCMFDPHCMYDPYATPESPGAQLKDIDYLRKTYPDAFKGYFEDLIKEEGTVFRLPLRTFEQSKIGKVVKLFELTKLLQSFRAEMKICLLFLRNVRRISIYTMSKKGELSEEYSVEMQIEEEQKLSQLKDLVRSRKSKNEVRDFFFNMQRLSYKVVIRDSNKGEYHWLLAQQFGSEDVNSLPELVSQAFKGKNLRLLPQGGVAILLHSSDIFETSMFKNFCYLPLPTQSGFRMCLNGHFALDNSRRDLWVGEHDYKAEWNKWLMEQVLAPVIGESIFQFRKSLSSDTEELSQDKFDQKMYRLHMILPTKEAAISDNWKILVTWVYQYVKVKELPIFEVFTPVEDEAPKERESFVGYFSRSFFPVNTVKHIKGKLSWHALQDSTAGFPLYFDGQKLEDCILNTLKRLGMKIGRSRVCSILHGAGIDIEWICPENVLRFLLSWEDGYIDACQPKLMSEIKETPYLCVANVCKLLIYVSKVENICRRFDRVPLLVCSDNKLMYFDSDSPVFCSVYGSLFPQFQREFIHVDLYSIMKSLQISGELISALKHFTLLDFAAKLSEQYASPRIEFPPQEYYEETRWIKRIWRYIQEEVERNCQRKVDDGKQICDWKEGKKYIIDALGEKTLYPVIKNRVKFLMPVKDAALTLFVEKTDDAYWKLPVPQPLIPEFLPKKLNLSATLDDPPAVLEVVYHWRMELNAAQAPYDELQFTTLIEYFGKFCERHRLSVTKLQRLRIYKDVAGCLQNLEGTFLVATQNVDSLSSFRKLSKKANRVILKPFSQVEQTLLKYIDPDCVVSDLELFSRLILPNLSLLPEAEFTELLEYLRDVLSNLRYKDRNSWSVEQQNVVSVLVRTPFIGVNGELVTAGTFFDPAHPVFAAMIPNNLPEKWAHIKWRYFLCLAGMVETLTAEMFVKFAQSLNVNDIDVKEKSQVLVEALYGHFCGSPIKGLETKLAEIKAIEFLIPNHIGKYEKIYPHFRTNSGLISIGSSTPECNMNLLWTTMSVLPKYVNRLIKPLEIKEDVPEDFFFTHVRNVTSVKASHKQYVCDVMESIYSHMTTVSENFLKRLAENHIPIVHLNEKQKFVVVDVVVLNITDEIEPYLYRAPFFYGRHFKLFEKIGVCKSVDCDHFVRVLNRIHENSQDKKLNPEEAKCMKLVMECLVDDMSNLQKIKEAVLYLPTKDDKLSKSTNMYVADNNEFERLTAKSLDKPLFVGLGTLKISKLDGDFVKNLPDILKPKFLSEVVTEIFDESVYEEVVIPETEKILSFISSRPFKKGVLRLLNHYGIRLSGENGEVTEETENKFGCVQVKALKEIKVMLELHDGTHLGSRRKRVYCKECSAGSFTLYITKRTPRISLYRELSLIYASVFGIPFLGAFGILMGIFDNLEDSQNIGEFLDSENIKAFGEIEDAVDLFVTDVGAYLPPEFIELLDNDFCRFHKGEIVAMKKYLEGEIGSPDDRVYIIVQVKEQLSSTEEVINDEYRISTGDKSNPLIVVKAHRLYKFVREGQREQNKDGICNADSVGHDTENTTMELVPSNDDDDREYVTAEISEEEIMKTIREQLRNIWRSVGDDHERRHLVRRLLLKWHPDKNRDKQDLCTRVVQYIQSLVRRLQNGETIPDDDDHTSSTREPPSDFYSSAFRPPPSFNRNDFRGSRGHGFRNRFRPHSNFSRERTKMGDHPEAKKWMKQADHDYNEACKWNAGSPCWIVYMCYQVRTFAFKLRM